MSHPSIAPSIAWLSGSSIVTVLSILALGSHPAIAQSSALGDPNANGSSGDVRPNEVFQGSGVSAQDLIRNIMLAPGQTLDDFNQQQSGRIDNAANEFLRQRQQRLEQNGQGGASVTPSSPTRN